MTSNIKENPDIKNLPLPVSEKLHQFFLKSYAISHLGHCHSDSGCVLDEVGRRMAVGCWHQYLVLEAADWVNKEHAD